MYSTVRYPRALRFTAENRLLTLHEGGGQPLSPVGQDAFQIPFDHQRDSGHRFEPPGSKFGSQSHPPLSARGLAAIMGFEFSRGFCRFSGFQSNFPCLHRFVFFGGEAGPHRWDRRLKSQCSPAASRQVGLRRLRLTKLRKFDVFTSEALVKTTSEILLSPSPMNEAGT